MELYRDHLAEQLSTYLGKRRWQHSLNVADTARELAQLHAPALAARAELAGMLHDNAKRLTSQELIEQALQHDIELTEGEREQPSLLHGKVGAALAPARFGVDDPAVLNAIADHVTGRPGMDLLSQLLFVADQAAADREFDGVDELRRIARSDLQLAVLLVSGIKLKYIVARRQVIHPETVEVYNAYARLIRQRSRQAE